MQREHISYTQEQSDLWGDVLKEISYYTGEFPERALQELIENPEEATKLLMYILEWAKDTHPDIPDSCSAHLYALYLLAQFREKSAFGLILELFVLASGDESDPLSSVISLDGSEIIVSVYDGNPELLCELILDTDCAFCSRQQALRALILLSQQKMIESSLVADVIIHLQDRTLLSVFAVYVGAHRASQFYDLVETLYDKAAIDTNILSKKSFTDLIAASREGFEPIYFIDNALESIRSLPWFQMKRDNAPGRNDPCPCGSGKKYKKCCL